MAQRGQRNKLWDIEDVDPQGGLGMTVLLARNEVEARAKFEKMHNGYLTITSITTCLAISLAMVEDVRGGTAYAKRV